MKRLLTSALLALFFCASLRAEEVKHSLIYLKLDALVVPDTWRNTSYYCFPGVGVGVRLQKGRSGMDLSFTAAITPLLLDQYGSLRGLYLFYPQPERKPLFYLGAGAGLNYSAETIFWADSWDDMGVHSCNTTTLEAAIGYEWRYAKYFTPFIQLELSQPVAYFNKRAAKARYLPTVTLSLGVGF